MAGRAGYLGEWGADVLLEAESEQNNVMAFSHHTGVGQWCKLQAGREHRRRCGYRDTQREDGAFHGLIITWEPAGVRRHDNEGTRQQNKRSNHDFCR